MHSLPLAAHRLLVPPIPLRYLLLTTHQDGTGAEGSVFGFEQPTGASLAAGTWTRHVLASGFTPNPTLLPSPGKHSRGSPG